MRRRKYGVSFSWKRALGISAARQRFARQTGIPTTRSGLERKLGRAVMSGGCSTVCVAAILLCLLIVWLFLG